MSYNGMKLNRGCLPALILATAVAWGSAPSFAENVKPQAAATNAGQAAPGKIVEKAADPYVWLESMAEATRKLTYRGHFVYQQGASLETLSVLHAYKNGQEKELISYPGWPAPGSCTTRGIYHLHQC